ncbi:MAG: ATP-binding protein [Bacilli bacterium]|nr:ATP-binding protein [Bacilli bacterium]
MIFQGKMISADISGIKNIEKNVHLDFTNATQLSGVFKESTVKTIYGPNGAGKTALIKAFALYKKIVLLPNSLFNPLFQEDFCGSVNKKTKTLRIALTIVSNESLIARYRHEIEIEANFEDNSLTLTKETVLKYTASMAERIVIRAETGKVTECDDALLKEELNKKTIRGSLLWDVIAILKSQGREEEKAAMPYLNLLLFAGNMTVVFANEESVVYRKTQTIDELIQAVKEESKNASKSDKYLAKIHKDRFGEYKKHIKVAERFIRLIKPGLKRIEIQHSLVGSYQFVNLFFDYDAGEPIDFEQESTGIKKIFSLCSAFEALAKGGVVFIDELDAGVHDIVISKLMEYACHYTQGQLIATTHHVDLMGAVLAKKHSIDFLSEDNVVTAWVRNGKYNPANAYMNGAIPHIVYNLFDFDFVDVFSESK